MFYDVRVVYTVFISVVCTLATPKYKTNLVLQVWQLEMLVDVGLQATIVPTIPILYVSLHLRCRIFCIQTICFLVSQVCNFVSCIGNLGLVLGINRGLIISQGTAAQAKVLFNGMLKNIFFSLIYCLDSKLCWTVVELMFHTVVNFKMHALCVICTIALNDVLFNIDEGFDLGKSSCYYIIFEILFHFHF